MNRMRDPFLLSNCCAVLLNLSPNIANLHSYASMRLVSMLLATMKRFTVLVMKNGGRVAGEEDVTSLLGMYSEVSDFYVARAVFVTWFIHSFIHYLTLIHLIL